MTGFGLGNLNQESQTPHFVYYFINHSFLWWNIAVD